MSNSGVQIVFGASFGDSGLNFPIDPVDHVFGHSLSFGVVDSNLVVQSLFNSFDQIGLSVEVFGFEGQSQVIFSLFLDESETGGLFLQSFNTVDFGFDEGDFVRGNSEKLGQKFVIFSKICGFFYDFSLSVVFPGGDLTVSVFKLNSVFSVDEWGGHVWNKEVTDESSHTESLGGFWSEDDPFFGDSGEETTPEEHVWSAIKKS